MYFGGFIVLIVISYIASAAILELTKEKLKHIHILALFIFLLLYGITNCSGKKDEFYKENPELRDDF
jgi:uncharacterized protein YacL